MSVRFEQPLWLWLAAAALPLAVIGFTLFRAMSPARRVSAVVLRAGLLALIAAILAGASSVGKTDTMAVVAVIDESGSVKRFVRSPGSTGGTPAPPMPPEEEVRSALGAAAAKRGADDLLGVVGFDARPWAVATLTRADPTGREFAAPGVEGTDIAAALRLARAMAPPDASARFLLASDGVQTSGDALAAARELAAAHVRVDVLPLSYDLKNEVVLGSIDAPPTAAGEAGVTLRIELRATGPSHGVLRVKREGVPVDLNGGAEGDGRRISLKPGVNVETVELRLPPGRVHRFSAEYEPDVLANGAAGPVYDGDSVLANNRAEAFTITPGKGSILLVDGVSGAEAGGAGSGPAAVWRDAGLSVEVVPPTAVPGDMLALEAFDLVVLENVPADAVPIAVQEQLVRFVRDMGGGLVMIGGPDSFAAGGWKGSALEAVLPVLLDLPERVISPRTAILFVLDDSGSMRRYVLGSARTQQELANDAAALAIKSLAKTDLVGVIAFNSDADVVAPLGPNSAPDATAERVRAISPGGGTNAVDALELARREMQRAGAAAKIKQIVVLSDGRSQGEESLPGMCEAFARDGVRVSTIAVGDDAALRTMAEMARRGNGTFYHALNPDALPRIFLKAVRTVRSPLIREEAFTPLARDAGSPLLAGLGAVPPLEGLSLASVREEPSVTTALVTPGGEPVLAHWNAGLGQVVAFTSDASHWAEGWIGWEGYRRLWTSVARQAGRPAAARGFSASARVENGDMTLRVEAADEGGRPLESLSMPATLYAPSGASREVSLTQTGPGVYEGRAAVSETGSHVALVRPSAGGRRLPPVVVGATKSEGAEFRSLKSDEALLRGIAETTGGRVVSLADVRGGMLFDRAGLTPREALRPLRSLLLLWAIGVLLADIATRRIAWDRWVSRRFGAGLGRAAAEAVRGRGEVAERTLAGLRARAAAGVGPVEPSLALSEADAARLAAAARDQRRARRLAAIDRNDEVPIIEERETRTEEGGDGLLAAKRRAMKRFEEEEEK